MKRKLFYGLLGISLILSMSTIRKESCGYVCTDSQLSFSTDKEFIIRDFPSDRPLFKEEVKAIVLHSTSNPEADALDHQEYVEDNDRNVSWHYTVDASNIAQHMSLWQRGVHCGSKHPLLPLGNFNTIGIEMCQNTSDIQCVLERTAYVVKAIRKVHGDIPVVFHEDVSGKDCPKMLSPALRDYVKGILNSGIETAFINTDSIEKAEKPKKQNFVNKIKAVIKPASRFDNITETRWTRCKQYGTTTPIYDMAQVCVETNYFTSDRFAATLNPGMIKYTEEFAKILKANNIEVENLNDFCKFKTEWQGWKARKLKLETERYKDCFTGTPKEQWKCIRIKGYAGNDTDYEEKIARIVKDIQANMK